MRRAAASLVLVLAASAAHAVVVPNLIVNPNFDSGSAGWTIPLPQSGSASWQAVDAIGSSHSGSLLGTASGQIATTYTMATQCVSLASSTPGSNYTLSARARHHNTPSTSLVVATAFYNSPDCSGTINVFPAFYLYIGSTADNTWVSLQATGTLPTGFTSMAITLAGISVHGTATRTEVDDVFFGPAAPSSCTPDAGTLCINDAPGDARFQISGLYSTSQGGGSLGGMHAIDLTSLGVAHGGLMWFFAGDNPELLIKVLNGCSITDHYWVFVSAGTNVSLDMFVKDTRTGDVAFYHNPDVSPFPAVQDLYALPCS